MISEFVYVFKGNKILDEPCEILFCTLLAGVLEDFMGWAVLDQLSKVHEDDVIGQTLGLAQDVADQHDSVLLFKLQKLVFDMLG